MDEHGSIGIIGSELSQAYEYLLYCLEQCLATSRSFMYLPRFQIHSRALHSSLERYTLIAFQIIKKKYSHFTLHSSHYILLANGGSFTHDQIRAQQKKKGRPLIRMSVITCWISWWVASVRFDSATTGKYQVFEKKSTLRQNPFFICTKSF